MLLACFFSAKKVQTVRSAEHDVGVDAIILCVGALCGTDGTTEGTELPQDVVELYRKGKGVAFAMPLSGVIGVNMYQFLCNNKQGRED